MEDENKKSQPAPVNTETEQFWKAVQVGRIINLLPDGGSLTIRRSMMVWEVECQIEGRRILKAKGHELGRYLQYIEDLLRTLKGLEGNA